MLPSFIVDCGIYPFDVFCYFAEDKEPMYKKLRKWLPESDIQELRKFDYGTAKSVMFPTGQLLLYMKSKPVTYFEYGTLAHEIFHLACFVMERVGIKYSYDSDEAFAYLIGYLTKEIMIRIDKLK
jgi:hypothetical protein